MPEQLDLLAMVRLSDPDTSHIAARLTNRRAGMAKVMAVLSRWPDEAVTDDEIAGRADMDPGSASKRRLDCQRQDPPWVEWSGTYGPSNTGSSSRKWRITTAGLQAVRGAAA